MGERGKEYIRYAREDMETGTEAFTRVMRRGAEAMAQGDAEILDSQTNLYQARLAVEKYAEAIGVAAKDLDPLVQAQIIYNSIMSETDDLIAAGGDDLLKLDRDLKSLGKSWGVFTDVLGVGAKELLGTGMLIREIDDLIITAAQAFTLSIGFIVDRLAELDRLYVRIKGHFWTAIPGMGERGKEYIRYAREDMETGTEAFTRVMRRGAEAMGMFGDEVDRSGELYERFREQDAKEEDYGAFADQILKRQALMEEHTKRLLDIDKTRDDRIAKIEADHQKTVLRIHRNAFNDRLKALRDWRRRVAKETRQENRRETHELEDHLRDLRHAEEKYRLARLHDLRLYNYERMMLVAEGDVLAIEDLDARFALEQEAASDNHKLQQRQRGEDYEEERRQRKELFELELQDMQAAYEERLREIGIREQELFNEQITKRYEAIQEADRMYDEEMTDEQTRHDESLLQWNRYWAVLAERTELGASTVTGIIRQFFGSGGEADQIVQDFTDRWLERQKILTQVQAAAARAVPAAANVYVRQWQRPPIGYAEEVAGYWQYAVGS